MSTNTQFRPGGGRCIFCGYSTNPFIKRGNQLMRSYQLTEEYLAEHPYVSVYARDAFNKLRFPESARSCRKCIMRAQRFCKKAQSDNIGEQKNLVIQYQPSIPRDPLDVINRKVKIEYDESEQNHSESPNTEEMELHNEKDLPIEVKSEKPDYEEDNNCVEIEVDGEVTGSHEDSEVTVKCEEIYEESATEEIQQEGVMIPISGYKRVPNSSSTCLIKGCVKVQRRRIHKFVRINVLVNQNIFIPSNARACAYHIASDVWRDLADHCRSLQEKFNGSHVTAMLELLKDRDSGRLNFQELGSIEDCVFKYVTGVEKPFFEEIMNETPALRRLRKTRTCLAAYLCYVRFAGSRDHLSSVFNMSNKQFKCIIKRVKACLGDRYKFEKEETQNQLKTET